MARISIIFLEAIIFSVILCMPFVVIGDDTVAVPADKAQVNAWFSKNIGPLASRKATLDPALVAAEAAPGKIITVKAKGGGNFKTLTDAVKSIPVGNKARVVIKLGPGNYTEKLTIPYTKPFITLIGDPKNMPVIVSSGTAAKFGIDDSATLAVESDHFVAANIIFVNSAPRPVRQLQGGQALALRIAGDKSAVYNCKLHGFQDTFCDDKGMHLFKDCFIEGTVDFIFGNGRSIYLNNHIHVIPGEKECWITAQARQNAQQDTGFSFLHATITGSGRNTFLGRSWMPYAKTVFAYAEMSDVIQPLGWSDNHKPATQKTTYFGEFACKGAGSNLATRAPFVKRLTAPQAHPFLTLGFIQASKWLLPPPQF